MDTKLPVFSSECPRLVHHHSYTNIPCSLCSQFRFSKKYFWFGDEAVGSEHLSAYLRDEKAVDAHHNAAWSSQTGKGLLYFAKRHEDKPVATGIINLVCFWPRVCLR